MAVYEVPASRTVEVNIDLSADPIELDPIVSTAVRDRRLETCGWSVGSRASAGGRRAGA